MHRRPLLILAVALVVTSCSGSEGTDPPDIPTTTAESSTVTSEPSFPVTIEAPNGSITIDERPERIVSISPTSTEVLFAVGAADQVVAVDSLSNHPPEAPVTDLSAFTPSVESLAAFDPDLVVMSFDPNGEVIPGLEALGIPVILHPTAANLSDAYDQWEQLGAATGNLAMALGVIAETEAAIMAAYDSVPVSTETVSYYYEIDPTYYSSTSTTFIGEVLAGTKMVNIADPADRDGFGFPQLTPEFIVGEDPDFILLADTKCCGQSADTVAERPGWRTMTAVRDGQVIELDDDVASRWSPRISELVEVVVSSLLERATANP